MQNSSKVRLQVTVHQSDYERLQLEAKRSGIAFEEYCALSMHLGMRSTQAWRENGRDEPDYTDTLAKASDYHGAACQRLRTSNRGKNRVEKSSKKT